MFLSVSGACLHDHLSQVESTGDTPTELEEYRQLSLPSLTEDVFDWFSEMSARRTYTDGGANALSFTEIDAWCRLSSNALTRLELEYILAFDNIWLSEYHKQMSRRK